MKYRLYDLDVCECWEDGEDGERELVNCYVNNCLMTDEIYCIPPSATEEDIIRLVCGDLGDIKNFMVEGEEGCDYGRYYKGIPYCQLRAEE
jgi:hypothetical protein